MFATVTKSPRGQNYEENQTDTADNITLLAMAQRWPGAVAVKRWSVHYWGPKGPMHSMAN